jgi:hypothetical protein
MLAHLRTEAYPAYRKHVYPPCIDGEAKAPSFEQNIELIEVAKKNLLEEII